MYFDLIQAPNDYKLLASNVGIAILGNFSTLVPNLHLHFGPLNTLCT